MPIFLASVITGAAYLPFHLEGPRGVSSVQLYYFGILYKR